MSGGLEGGDGAAEEKQVPEGSGADQEDVQRRPSYGRSTRAVATLPRRSVARRTTTRLPWPVAGGTGMS